MDFLRQYAKNLKTLRSCQLAKDYESPPEWPEEKDEDEDAEDDEDEDEEDENVAE